MNITAQFIVENCVAYAEENNLFLCGKQPVYVVIVTKDNKLIFGSNYRKNNVECNRIKLQCASGKGYEHCDGVCQQLNHAERVAIKIANDNNIDITDAIMYLHGHSYCCDPCKEAINAAGINPNVIFV